MPSPPHPSAFLCLRHRSVFEDKSCCRIWCVSQPLLWLVRRSYAVGSLYYDFSTRFKRRTLYVMGLSPGGEGALVYKDEDGRNQGKDYGQSVCPADIHRYFGNVRVYDEGKYLNACPGKGEGGAKSTHAYGKEQR